MSVGGRTIRVLVTPAGIDAVDFEDQFVIVIDVLRACTTLAYALNAGARGVIPVETVEEASRLATSLGREGTLLGGERNNVRVEGFDLGNSPADYRPESVQGKTIVLSTTNGARAIAHVSGARECVATALVTRRSTARRAAAHEQVLILCAGQNGFFSFEDFYCAGLVIDEMLRAAPGTFQLRDGARAALDLARRQEGGAVSLLRGTDHGARLVADGFEEDLVLAGQLDRFSFVPVLRDRRIVAEEPKGAALPPR